MQLLENLRILRRRWYLVAAVAAIGFLAGAVTAPGSGNRPVLHRSQAVLIVNPLGDARNTKTVNLDQASLLATTGHVPDAVAARLKLSSGLVAKDGLTVRADKDKQALLLTVTSATGPDAEARAGAFADALSADIARSGQEKYQRDTDAAQTRINDQQNQVSQLTAQKGPVNNPSLDAQINAASSQLAVAIANLQQISAQGAPPDPLVIVDKSKAQVVAPVGVRAPDGRPERGLLIAVVGALLGCVVAIGLERIDTRIGTKETAEAAFGCPVIAEIPILPDRKVNRSTLMTVRAPASPFVEAFRNLRTVTALTLTEAELARRGGDEIAPVNRVIVVTSGRASEGKTTTAAHLAAVLAEVNRTVLLVSADIRRPLLHEFFGVRRAPGITNAFDMGAGSHRQLVVRSVIPGLEVLPSGDPTSTPAPLLLPLVRFLDEARARYDYVIVDTAPMLVANDANELMRAADAVIVAARARRTTIESARRTADGLRRIGAPVLGVVLSGLAIDAGYSYQRNGYYSPLPAKGRGRWRAPQPGATLASTTPRRAPIEPIGPPPVPGSYRSPEDPADHDVVGDTAAAGELQRTPGATGDGDERR